MALQRWHYPSSFRLNETEKDLLDANAMERFRPLYDSYLQRAANHLRAGWRYTTDLPFRCVRVRLACAWPILIGMRTAELLRQGNVLDDQHRIKLNRSEIRRLMIRSALLYPNRRAWNSLLG